MSSSELTLIKGWQWLRVQLCLQELDVVARRTDTGCSGHGVISLKFNCFLISKFVTCVLKTMDTNPFATQLNYSLNFQTPLTYPFVVNVFHYIPL